MKLFKPLCIVFSLSFLMGRTLCAGQEDIPCLGGKWEFGQRESSRGPIDRKADCINLIQPALRSSDPEALAQSKFTFSTQAGYTSKKWRMFEPQLVKNSYRLWLSGDFLFWKSNMGSLEYGVTSKSSTNIQHGHVKHPAFDWDCGLRLGLGYKLPHDNWDVFANYTYVHGKAHGHAGGSDTVVFPVWATNFRRVDGPFFARSAKAHWDMNLNIGDVELGRTCLVGHWLTIRPFVGVRGLVIDQDYQVLYAGGTVAPLDRDKVHMDTDFWGVGIRMGANTLWGMGKGMSIYGNGSVALLGSDFDVHEHEKLKKADMRLMDVERDVDNVVVTADLALGLQWDYMLSKDRYHFGVKLGWEFNLFFNQNQLFNFQDNNAGAIKFQNDDLTFEGVTLGFRFDF